MAAAEGLVLGGSWRVRRALALAWLAGSVLQAPAEAHRTAPLAWSNGDGPRSHDDHQALVVTANVAVRSCLMQLDTGLNSAVVWQEPDSLKEAQVMVDVEFLGLRRSVGTSQRVAGHLQHCAPGTSIGSFGNAFFDGGSLTIDLKKMALHYQAGSALASDPAAEPMFYARWTAQGGHPLVEVRQDGVLMGYGLLDTGSASFGFAPLSEVVWNRLTASAPLARTDRVRIFSVSSWNRQHACFETAPAASLQVGHWAMRSSPVDYCPELGFTPPLRLEGVVGLEAFSNAVVTIDYPAGRWLARPAQWIPHSASSSR